MADKIETIQERQAAFEARAKTLSHEIHDALDKLEHDLALHEKDIKEAEKSAIDESTAAFIEFIVAAAVA